MTAIAAVSALNTAPVTVTVPASVWKAAADIVNPKYTSHALRHALFTDGCMYATDGKVLMRYILDQAMPTGEWLLPLGKLPAGTQSVRLTFTPGQTDVEQSIVTKAGELSATLTAYGSPAPAIVQVFNNARDGQDEPLDQYAGLDAGQLAQVMKHAAAIMADTRGKGLHAVVPRFRGKYAVYIECPDDTALAFVIMPMSI